MRLYMSCVSSRGEEALAYGRSGMMLGKPNDDERRRDTRCVRVRMGVRLTLSLPTYLSDEPEEELYRISMFSFYPLPLRLTLLSVVTHIACFLDRPSARAGRLQLLCFSILRTPSMEHDGSS